MCQALAGVLWRSSILKQLHKHADCQSRDFISYKLIPAIHAI